MSAGFEAVDTSGEEVGADAEMGDAVVGLELLDTSAGEVEDATAASGCRGLAEFQPAVAARSFVYVI